MKEFWNERYGQQEYIYGLLPNVFFKEELTKLAPGRLLMLAEGEGRNAVYAATQGWQVDAFDYATEGRKKALQLAESNNVTINYETALLEEYKVEPHSYDAVGLVFVHMPPALREIVFPKVINGLKSGGKLIMEVFEKSQLGLSSGGPKQADLLYSKEELEKEVSGLNVELMEYANTHLEEGAYHAGAAKVLRLVATKP